MKPEIFCRVTMRKAVFSSPVNDVMICSGYLLDFDGGRPPSLELVRQVEPDEPDPEIEVGYSKNALEPTTIVFRDKKRELTLTLFKMFRYVYDLCRMEGQTEFDFSEISEAIAGDELGISKSAMESNLRRLQKELALLLAPVDLTFNKERVYVSVKNNG